VKTEAIKVDLAAKDKESVIRELVASLTKSGQLKAEEQENIIQAILKREELGSTGIGRGIAVPHTKHPSVKDPIGTIGVSQEGVEFQSLDGEKVQLFFMLISPPDRPGDHLRALENISKQLQDDMFCRFLKQSKTAEDIKQVLEEADNNQFVS
jgi:PTS system fructose-specific IIA component/PTS system nitrogen regulatory IIA component